MKAQNSWIKSYGTLNCGLETMRMAWQKLEHVFSVRPQEQVGSPDLPGPQPKFVFKKRRSNQDLLSSHPVDLLVVEVAHRVQPKKYSARSEHMKIVETTPASSQPKIIIETWGQEASAWTHGPTGKETRVRWESLGYLSRFKRVDAATIGGGNRSIPFDCCKDTEGPHR